MCCCLPRADLGSDPPRANPVISLSSLRLHQNSREQQHGDLWKLLHTLAFSIMALIFPRCRGCSSLFCPVGEKSACCCTRAFQLVRSEMVLEHMASELTGTELGEHALGSVLSLWAVWGRSQVCVFVMSLLSLCLSTVLCALWSRLWSWTKAGPAGPGSHSDS